MVGDPRPYWTTLAAWSEIQTSQVLATLSLALNTGLFCSDEKQVLGQALVTQP